MAHAGGRPPRAVPTTRWEVRIDQNIAAAVELILMPPMKEKAKYGIRSQLIESLLRKWLADRIAANKLAEAAAKNTG